MTAWSTCSSPRAMSRRCRTSPPKDPNNLLLQGGDGKFTEAGDKAGVASCRQSRAARRWPISTSTACSIWSSSTAGQTAQVWRNTSAERRPLDRGPAAAAGAEPRRDRRLDRGALRTAMVDAPRDHRRRRPRQRPDRLVAFRPGRHRTKAEVRVHLARRHRRRLAARRRRQFLHPRARQAGPVVDGEIGQRAFEVVDRTRRRCSAAMALLCDVLAGQDGIEHRAQRSAGRGRPARARRSLPGSAASRWARWRTRSPCCAGRRQSWRSPPGSAARADRRPARPCPTMATGAGSISANRLPSPKPSASPALRKASRSGPSCVRAPCRRAPRCRRR